MKAHWWTMDSEKLSCHQNETVCLFKRFFSPPLISAKSKEEKKRKKELTNSFDGISLEFRSNHTTFATFDQPHGREKQRPISLLSTQSRSVQRVIVTNSSLVLMIPSISFRGSSLSTVFKPQKTSRTRFSILSTRFDHTKKKRILFILSFHSVLSLF